MSESENADNLVNIRRETTAMAAKILSKDKTIPIFPSTELVKKLTHLPEKAVAFFSEDSSVRSVGSRR